MDFRYSSFGSHRRFAVPGSGLLVTGLVLFWFGFWFRFWFGFWFFGVHSSLLSRGRLESWRSEGLPAVAFAKVGALAKELFGFHSGFRSRLKEFLGFQSGFPPWRCALRRVPRPSASEPRGFQSGRSDRFGAGVNSPFGFQSSLPDSLRSSSGGGAASESRGFHSGRPRSRGRDARSPRSRSRNPPPRCLVSPMRPRSPRSRIAS